MQNIKNTNKYLMKIIVPYMNTRSNFLIILMKKIFGHLLKNKWEVFFKNTQKVLIKIQWLVRINFNLMIKNNRKMKVKIFLSICNIQIIHQMCFWIQDHLDYLYKHIRIT